MSKKKRGRPPKGSALVEKYAGSDEAKSRLKTILATVAGEMTVAEACDKLGVSETRFLQLRDEALGGAMAELEPGMVGRPKAEESVEQKRIRELEAQVKMLRYELEGARISAKIAVVMPQALTMTREEAKKSLEEAGIYQKLEREMEKLKGK
jgi:hypothetical protein